MLYILFCSVQGRQRSHGAWKSPTWWRGCKEDVSCVTLGAHSPVIVSNFLFSFFYNSYYHLHISQHVKVFLILYYYINEVFANSKITNAIMGNSKYSGVKVCMRIACNMFYREVVLSLSLLCVIRGVWCMKSEVWPLLKQE